MTGRLLDDTFFRLYDACSASAVMINVPGTIPYFLMGRPSRIFFTLSFPASSGQANQALEVIYMVTTWVMPNDMGVNPLGTIGEFYINFGFAGDLLGRDCLPGSISDLREGAYPEERGRACMAMCLSCDGTIYYPCIHDLYPASE